MDIPAHIFRKYDIRGIYPSELNEENIKIIGCALGSIFIEKDIRTVVVGRDNRQMSLPLSNALMKGLISTGVNVNFTDITIQPAVHFFSFDKYYDAVINVTASHNPKQYSGLKIDYSNAKPFYGDDIQVLYKRVLSGNFQQGNGVYSEKDLNTAYINFLIKRFNFQKKTKVIVYCGNGATSEIAPKIFDSLNIGEIPVYCEYDSSFPHGVPDPEDVNLLKRLSERVLEEKADVGIAFDGDGDRLGVVDEAGNVYSADELLMLFAKDVLKEYGPTQVLYDIKSTQALEKVIKKYGGNPVMLRTGRAYVLDYMLSGRSVLGAELSGHFYFGDDYFGYDDALYAACRLLKILEKSNKPLSQLMREFPNPVNTPEIKVSCDDDKKFSLVENIKEYIEKNIKHVKLMDIDGVRVSISDTGWFLIRASNTSNYLSIRAEGRDQDEVEGLVEILVGILKHFNLNL